MIKIFILVSEVLSNQMNLQNPRNQKNESLSNSLSIATFFNDKLNHLYNEFTEKNGQKDFFFIAINQEKIEKMVIVHKYMRSIFMFFHNIIYKTILFDIDIECFDFAYNVYHNNIKYVFAKLLGICVKDIAKDINLRSDKSTKSHKEIIRKNKNKSNNRIDSSRFEFITVSNSKNNPEEKNQINNSLEKNYLKNMHGVKIMFVYDEIENKTGFMAFDIMQEQIYRKEKEYVLKIHSEIKDHTQKFLDLVDKDLIKIITKINRILLELTSNEIELSLSFTIKDDLIDYWAFINLAKRSENLDSIYKDLKFSNISEFNSAWKKYRKLLCSVLKFEHRFYIFGFLRPTESIAMIQKIDQNLNLQPFKSLILENVTFYKLEAENEDKKQKNIFETVQYISHYNHKHILKDKIQVLEFKYINRNEYILKQSLRQVSIKWKKIEVDKYLIKVVFFDDHRRLFVRNYYKIKANDFTDNIDFQSINQIQLIVKRIKVFFDNVFYSYIPVYRQPAIAFD